MRSAQQKKCRVCAESYNILARCCPRCGDNNDQFFNMPKESRESYIELFHDREVYVAMVARAVQEGCTVETLYKKAAEQYLTNLSRRRVK